MIMLCLYALGSLLLLHGVYQFIKYLVVFSGVKKFLFPISINNTSSSFNKINVLAPVLHEEKTLESFLTHLAEQEYPKAHFTVYVITTEREYLNNTGLNTIQIFDRIKPELFAKGLDIQRIHYPRMEGHKSDQLNFAFQKILKDQGQSKVSESFFFMLDADSKVDPTTLDRVNSVIEPEVEIYQQPLLWFKNINSLQSPFMQSFAFLQSYFVISYEIPMFIGKFFKYRLKYLVGHGMCLKGSFLIKVGGFPSIIEDVRLGRLVSLLNLKVKLIPNFGIVETAKKLSVYIKQSSVWFFGCGLFVEDFRYFSSLNNSKNTWTIRSFILVVYGFFKAFRWLNKGLFHLLGIILSIIYFNPHLLLLFIISLLINSSIPALVLSLNLSKIWQSKFINKSHARGVMIKAVIFSPVMYMINFIGLYYGLLKLIRFYLWGQIELPKTDR